MPSLDTAVPARPGLPQCLGSRRGSLHCNPRLPSSVSAPEPQQSYCRRLRGQAHLTGCKLSVRESARFPQDEERSKQPKLTNGKSAHKALESPKVISPPREMTQEPKGQFGGLLKWLKSDLSRFGRAPSIERLSLARTFLVATRGGYTSNAEGGSNPGAKTVLSRSGAFRGIPKQQADKADNNISNFCSLAEPRSGIVDLSPGVLRYEMSLTPVRAIPIMDAEAYGWLRVPVAGERVTAIANGRCLGWHGRRGCGFTVRKSGAAPTSVPLPIRLDLEGAPTLR